ncbi:Thivi_2564 family membrane protein [uncultured Desulfobacter sp.]|nr:Thivi_2564 family membrane protein [uncultured Desulfobacter sp.]
MVNNSIPMDRKMKQILNIVVVIVVVLWVGSQFSGFNFLP